MATCDNVVPNPFNLLLFGVAGLTQAPPNEFQIFRNTTAPTPNPDCIPALGLGTGAVAHSFLLDWGATGGGTSNRNITVAGQNDAASFLFDLTAPPALEAQ